MKVLTYNQKANVSSHEDSSHKRNHVQLLQVSIPECLL